MINEFYNLFNNEKSNDSRAIIELIIVTENHKRKALLLILKYLMKFKMYLV